VVCFVSFCFFKKREYASFHLINLRVKSTVSRGICQLNNDCAGILTDLNRFENIDEETPRMFERPKDVFVDKRLGFISK
jgi:hypothetical protein